MRLSAQEETAGLIPHESNNSYYNNILSVSLSVTKSETTEVALKLALDVVFLLSD